MGRFLLFWRAARQESHNFPFHKLQVQVVSAPVPLLLEPLFRRWRYIRGRLSLNLSISHEGGFAMSKVCAVQYRYRLQATRAPTEPSETPVNYRKRNAPTSKPISP